MKVQLIASLADNFILMAVGLFCAFGQRRLTAKILDPQKREKRIRWMKVGGVSIFALGLFRAIWALAAVESDATIFAREMNRVAPRQMDISTRLDRAVAVSGNEVVVYFTLTTVNGADVDLQKLRSVMLKHVANPIGGAIFKRAGNATVVLRYSGKDGVAIGDVTIPPGSSKKGL